MLTDTLLLEILRAFSLEEAVTDCKPFGNGHINDTFALACQKDGKKETYILQKINRYVFPRPDRVGENIEGVSAWLKKKVEAVGGDPLRETLQYLRSREGLGYYQASDGEYWRLRPLIDRSEAYEQVTDPALFQEGGRAFGSFCQMLCDYPAETLYETIEAFHDTPSRYRDFEKIVEQDPCGRVKDVGPEIAFIRQHAAGFSALTDQWKKGILPTRVTHNDTKINNVLFDTDTQQAICVIDLDTIMPGLIAYDFGDAIRIGACTVAEDEPDWKKAVCDMALFEAFARGFLGACGKDLTEDELESLPVGAVLMTLETGIRFLGDYLAGDVYFKIDHPTHNLDRARVQFHMAADLEEKLPAMQAIIQKITA